MKKFTPDFFKKLIADANSFQQKIDKEISAGQTLVILVGNTGSGKSSITALLTGQDLKVRKLNDFLFNLEAPGFKIGYGSKAITKSPTLYHIKKGSLSLCDFPGFKDPGGPDIEILNSYQMFKLLDQKNGKRLKIKILYVISDDEMRSARGQDLGETLKDRIQQMFPKVSSINNSVGLVITKCFYLKLADNMYDAESLNSFEPSNIFLFPRPKPTDQIYNIKNSDLKRLKEFVNSPESCLHNPENQITLSRNAELMLNATQFQLITENSKWIEQIFNSLSEEFSEKYKEDNEIGNRIDFLKKQYEIVENMKNSSYDAKRLVSEIRSKIPIEKNTQQLQNLFENLISTYEFAHFIIVIFNDNLISDKFQESKNNKFMDLITYMKSLIQNAEQNKKLRDETEKQKKDFEKKCGERYGLFNREKLETKRERYYTGEYDCEHGCVRNYNYTYLHDVIETTYKITWQIKYDAQTKKEEEVPNSRTTDVFKERKYQYWYNHKYNGEF